MNQWSLNHTKIPKTGRELKETINREREKSQTEIERNRLIAVISRGNIVSDSGDGSGNVSGGGGEVTPTTPVIGVYVFEISPQGRLLVTMDSNIPNIFKLNGNNLFATMDAALNNPFVVNAVTGHIEYVIGGV